MSTLLLGLSWLAFAKLRGRTESEEPGAEGRKGPQSLAIVLSKDCQVTAKRTGGEDDSWGER